MNEVEKLYSLAGVEPDYNYFTLFDDKVHKIGRTMHLCKEELKHWLENYQNDYVAIKVIRVDKDYPPFTAEKQIELIKWLARKSHITIGLGLPWGQYDDSWWTVTSKNGGLGTNAYKFEEALASFVNSKWQDLTEEERKQIKEILE